MENITEAVMESAAALSMIERSTKSSAAVLSLTFLSEAQWHLDRAMRARVSEARAAGETWYVIGRALGVSAQAAQQRYGR